MSDGIKIPVSVPGAEQARQQLDQLGAAAKGVGDKASQGQKPAQQQSENTNQKLSKMGGILNTLKGQILGMVGAWLGLSGVQKIIERLIAKLERVQSLQKDIYDKSVGFLEIGQSLEMQTGTKGQQKQWASKAADLQKSGGLASTEAAQQMLVSMDIAFAAQGGIKNPKIMNLANQLAPFIGANQMGGAEVSKMFEFAGAAKVQPTEAAYKEYFAKLYSGYTTSKATNFGQFMTGLQQGATGYLAQGGSLDKAISLFSGARSVQSNEALAATMMDQASRLASGAYEKPRAAMEKSLGVKWSDLSTDQRMSAMMRYVSSIPESQRSATLAKQGFPVELTNQLGKLVSAEATTTMASTGNKVSAATAKESDMLAQLYLTSDLGRQRQIDAQKTQGIISVAPKFSSWQQRLQKAQNEFDLLVSQGEDKYFVRDKVEAQIIAMEQMVSDVDTMMPGMDQNSEKYKQAAQLKVDLIDRIGQSKIPLIPYFSSDRLANKRGQDFSERLGNIQNQAPTIINDNSINYHPRVGDDRRGPRYTQD